jgi:hypothetical protein
MSSVGYDTWFRKSCPTIFKVENISIDKRRLKLFNYPIAYGGIRDLMEIPFVSEADIRHSLLKGELKVKILAKEIRVVDSNIDLLQFDDCQKQFLMDAGVIKGLEVDGYILAELPYIFKQNVELIGAKDNVNRVFTVLPGDKFINGIFDSNDFRIIINHNGRRLIQNIDYLIYESGGIGTGFDTIQLISLVPNASSKLIADYVIKNQ